MNAMETEESLLTKQAIIERIKATVIPLTNEAFIMDEWKSEDTGLIISWKIAGTPIGDALIASTTKGVCFLGFINGNPAFAWADLQQRFPTNTFKEEDTEWQREALMFIIHPKLNLPVHLHLKGTPFQLNIWKKLALIPFGGLTTYADLGSGTRSARAAGTAVGANPVSYILPCHRAVRTDGSFDRYYWGNNVKRELLTYEILFNLAV